MPDPSLPFPKRVVLRVLTPSFWLAVAAAAAAAAFILLAANLSASIENKRAEDTCRSRIAGAVSQAQAEVSIAVGDGLEALAREDDVAMSGALADFEAARHRLDAALEARERSEETCDQR